MTDQAWLAFLLQGSDAMFPTGAYAHSLGMEEMIRDGHVSNEASLLQFLRDHIVPALARVDLPLVAEAHRGAKSGDLESLLLVDRLAGALRAARELRTASLQTGRRRLAMLVATRPTPLLSAYHEAALARPIIGHHAVVWGAACSEVPLASALTAYLYQSLSCFCSAAPKLIRVGQEAAQRVLTTAMGEALPIVETAQHVSRDEIGWFDPVLDIASMRHEIADERLFIS